MFISLYYSLGNFFRSVFQFISVSSAYSRLLFILYIDFNINDYLSFIYSFSNVSF